MSSPKRRYGVLEVEEVLGANYHYRLLTGTNPDGQTRQLVTRGPGRHLAATRIPIQLPAETAKGILDIVDVSNNKSAYDVFQEYVRGTPLLLNDRRVYLKFLQQMRVLLIQMPREGNLVSGLEWNAPGGTGEPGENFEQIAAREFSEETDLVPLFTWQPFPRRLQFASGIYDEVQNISFVFVTGNPTRLVEGARAWKAIPLPEFPSVACELNHYVDGESASSEYCPIDGKVVMAVMYALMVLSHLD